jgi:hypothetical protein
VLVLVLVLVLDVDRGIRGIGKKSGVSGTSDRKRSVN